MAAFDFPSSPTVGQVYQYYTWDGEKWYSTLGGIAGPKPETVAFLARTSGLDATHRNAYTGLIDGLVTDGVWSKLDVLHIYAAQDSTNALLNLVSSSFPGVLNGSPTFTADRGFTGVDASTTVYINTQFNPTTASSPKFVQNSAHVSAWCMTNATGILMGVSSNSGNNTLSHVSGRSGGGDNKTYLRANCNAGTSGVATSSSIGHFIANRSTSTQVTGYKDGGFFNQDAGSGSSAPINVPFPVLACRDTVLGIFGATASQVAAISIGSSLNATEAFNLFIRIRSYMTALGLVSAEVSAFLARASGLDATHIAAYTALIDGLVTDGIWSQIEILNIFATNSSANALLNLKGTAWNGGTSTLIGAPTFTADRGFTGVEGSTSIGVDTQFNMTAGIWSSNSAHQAAWIVTNGQSDRGCMGWYYYISGNVSILVPRDTSDRAHIKINDNGSGTTVASTDSRGFWHQNRDGAATSQLYKNGVNILNNTTTSIGLNALNHNASGYNDLFNIQGYGQQMAMISIGASLTSAQAAKFYTRVRAYMTAVGVP
jgi:hypothetical protein